MAHITIQLDVSSRLEIKNGLSWSEVFLDVLDRDSPIHHDVSVRSQAEDPLIAHVICRHLNVCGHRDVTGVGSGRSGCYRDICSGIQHRLDTTRSRGVDHDIGRIEEEMSTRSELQLSEKIVIAQGLPGDFDESAFPGAAGGISLALEIRVAIRPDHDVTTLACIRAGIELGRVRNEGAGRRRCARRSLISSADLDAPTLPRFIPRGDRAGHFNASAVRVNLGTAACFDRSRLLDRSGKGIAR